MICYSSNVSLFTKPQHQAGEDLGFWVRGAWGSGLATPDNFENMDGKMEHSKAIWNANLELQRQVKNKIERVFWRYLKQFWTTEKILKTWTLNGAFWRYFKRFGTAEKKWKKKTLNEAFWRYLKQFGTA